MGYKAEQDAWDRPDVKKPAHRHVLLALARHAHNDGGGIRPSVARLCRLTGYTSRTVQAAIAALLAIPGVLVCERKGGGRANPSHYRYLFFVDKPVDNSVDNSNNTAENTEYLPHGIGETPQFLHETPQSVQENPAGVAGEFMLNKHNHGDDDVQEKIKLLEDFGVEGPNLEAFAELPVSVEKMRRTLEDCKAKGQGPGILTRRIQKGQWALTEEEERMRYVDNQFSEYIN